MKHNRFISVYTLIILLITFTEIASGQPFQKRNNLFDFNWRFHRGGAQGAEDPSYDDSGWRIVDLPHDWSIEDMPGTNSPFSRDAISQVSGGFTTGGTGWYRKSFTISEDLKNKKFVLLFEGIYMNPEVWLNGKLLGEHPYGYTSFWYDISDKILIGKENVVAVKVKNEGENSRWYSGSGIYRHVWLNVTEPVHLDTWGTSVTTPDVSDQVASIVIKTPVSNQGNENIKTKLTTTIKDQYGNSITREESENIINQGQTVIFSQSFRLSKPALWSTENPVLYKAISEVRTSGGIVDSTETNFGVRSISYSTSKGFMLNGKSLKLKGGCVHHDNGILGAKAYDRAEERRVELLKANGFNAVRSAHNPPSPAFLNACDKVGLMVIDESFDMWNKGKNPHDYHLFFSQWWKKDMESMIMRDRNHPSVIMWSIGNEIPDGYKDEVAVIADSLARYIRNIDPTRPVTSAVNDLRPELDKYISSLDIAGYNYASGLLRNNDSIYKNDHKRVPQRIMIETESYPLDAFRSWMDVTDHDYLAGDFVWTAFDYIGEASIGWRGYMQEQNFYPWNLAYCGDLDICGWKRPQSYYRDVLWGKNKISVWVEPKKPYFEINSQRIKWSRWNWNDVNDSWNASDEEGKTRKVLVYSSFNEAELFINGKSLGRKVTDKSDEYTASWDVPYEPGTLKAVGYDEKGKAGETEIRTSGEATQIRLTADRDKIKADGQDLCYITVELTDDQGIRNPDAKNPITFEITGTGTIAGLGNADPVSVESYQGLTRKAWHGRCMIIIKSGTRKGEIRLNATSPGLKSATLILSNE